MDKLLAWLCLLSILIHLEARPQVNPCLALKLPLCKVKKEFADEHGIRAPTTTSAPVTRASSPPFRSQSTFTREGDTLIVTPSQTVKQEEPPLRSTLLDRLRSTTSNRGKTESNNANNACKGLRFCVLSNAATRNRQASRTTTTEDPLLAQFDFESSSSNNGNLRDLVLNGDIETAKKLIEEGADVNAEDQHGNSVLHIAAQNGRTGIIDDLILRGADVNKGNNHKNTALHLAAQNGWDEIAAKLLRAKKIQVNFKDLHANTALHLAAQNGQIKVAQHLIDAGADVNAPNAHKHIPLHLAAQNGHLALSKLLVESGTNLDYKDLIGNTPLHTAVHTTHTEIAKYLVASGADETSRNSSGLTPFQLSGRK